MDQIGCPALVGILHTRDHNLAIQYPADSCVAKRMNAYLSCSSRPCKPSNSKHPLSTKKARSSHGLGTLPSNLQKILITHSILRCLLFLQASSRWDRHVAWETQTNNHSTLSRSNHS